MSIVPVESRETFWRSLQALNVTRILIASLLLLFWGMGDLDGKLSVGLLSYRNICIAYLAMAILFAMLTLREHHRFITQLQAQILADIAVVSLLYIAAGGIRGGMAILFLFPLASAAILVPITEALLFASIATIMLLIENWYRMLTGHPDAPITQAGLYGASFFAVVFVVNRLAAKLIAQETLAIQRGLDLQIQQAINNLVIEDMDDGVLTVDNDGVIFTCNPAAAHKLSLITPNHAKGMRLTDIPYLKPLADAFLAWRRANDDRSIAHVEPIAYLVIKSIASPPVTANAMHGEVPALGSHLRARFATASPDPFSKNHSVIFLQDVASIENQAQQLKLAAMGRLTASIAHEVRNPLAAIAHAAALLSEDITAPGQARLLKIVSDNVARMNRMIEDILNLSRKGQSQELVDLTEIIAELKLSFDELHRLPFNAIIIEGLEHHQVRFDPMHLREVLLNLLTNALRYASGQPGCIRIRTVRATSRRLELHVQDDGPSISPEVRAHLFEPFYTTSSQGTGLGLYLARELCSNNDALLDYEFHHDDLLQEPAGRFVITFAAPDLTQEGIST